MRRNAACGLLNPILLSLTILFLTNVEAYAQKIWSLKECVDYALSNNLSVKKQALNSEISGITYSQNKYSLAPSLNGSGSSSYNWGRSVDPYSYSFINQEFRSTNLSLNGNVTVFNGFRLLNTLQQSKLDYFASRSDLQKLQNDISLNVITQYLQVLYAKEQLKTAENRVDESRKQRDRTNLMTEAGSMTRGNLLDAESQLANEELNKVNAENQLSSAKLTLMQLLELKVNSDFDIEVPETTLPDQAVLNMTPDQIYDAALKNLPEINSAELNIQSSRKAVAVAKSSLMPRISLSGSLSSGYSSTTLRPTGKTVDLGYQPTGAITSSGEAVLSPVRFQTYEKTPFNDQLNNNLSKSLGLSLTVPIFSAFSAHNGVTRARINLKNSELTAQQTKNAVYKSIQQAFNDAIASKKKFEALSKSVLALQESFSYAEKKFNAGLLSSLEYLTATNNLAKAKSEHIQAKYEYIFKIKILDFYAGNPLVF